MSYVPRFRQTAGKRREADALVEILRNKKNGFIMGGDFNSLPNSYTVKAIQRHLRNAGPATNENTWTTKPFSYGGFSADTLGWRIDYVFATPDIRVTSARIVDTPHSDHLPLLIEVDL
jgi:endonuclease/exonuclease/phosphatase family metal-dependent hydrolase